MMGGTQPILWTGVNAVTCKVTQVSVCVVDDGQLLIARKLDSAETGFGGAVDLRPSLPSAAFAATQLNEFCFLHFRDWDWLLF